MNDCTARSSAFSHTQSLPCHTPTTHNIYICDVKTILFSAYLNLPEGGSGGVLVNRLFCVHVGELYIHMECLTEMKSLFHVLVYKCVGKFKNE